MFKGEALKKFKKLLTVLSLSLGLFLALWATLNLDRGAQAAGSRIESWPEGMIIRPSALPAALPYPAAIRVQATVSLTPSKDNTLIEDTLGTLSNGAGPNFFVGRTSQVSGSIRRGVIAFNIAGSAIPTDATILSATLRLNMSQPPSGPQTAVSLHRLLADWGEGTSIASGGGGGGAPATLGDATWTYAISNTVLWLTPGGDFSPTARASASVGGVGVYTWSSPQMVADVQAWLNAPATNFGWLLQGNESASGTAKRFDSRENTIVANRPVLMIVFAQLTQTLYLPLILK